MEFTNNYLDWLKTHIQEKKVNENITEITMPFLDRHNDFSQIYIVQKDTDFFKVTDFGYVLNDLEMSGIDILNSDRRKEIFNLTLRRLGIDFDAKDNSLYIESNFKNLPAAQHRLIQAMLDINNMFMLSKATVQNLFIEDVTEFLDTNDFFYSDNIHLIGKSKLEHRYDFLIQRTKSKPERLVKALNRVDKNEIERTIFSWIDTSELRNQNINKSSELIVILNDQDKSINPELTQAFSQYDIKEVLWTEREMNKELFAS